MTTAAQGADCERSGRARRSSSRRARAATSSRAAATTSSRTTRSTRTRTSNEVRGLPKGDVTLNQPGVPPGRPGRHSRRLRRPRQAVLLRQLRREPARRARSPPTRTLLLPDAQNGIFRYHRRPGGGVNLFALAAPNGSRLDARSDGRQAARGHPRLDEQRRRRVQRDHRQPERGALHVPAAGRVGRRIYPTVRIDYNLSRNHRAVRHVVPAASSRRELRHDQHAAGDLAGLPGLRRAGLGALGV